MSEWLFEGRLSVTLLLAAGVVFCLALGWQRRQRSLFTIAGVLGLLLAGYYLLDRLVETDAEQIRRKIQALADAANAHDVNGILLHVSDNFRGTNAKSKAELRALAHQHLS